MTETVAAASLAEQLAKPFEHTYTRNVGGVELTYVSSADVVERLNQVLGIDNWSFSILQHFRDDDSIVVVGSLEAVVGSRVVTRQAFGSAQVKRKRDGNVLDLGNDYKAAATDALKKSAQSLGVGLYLAKKEPSETESPAGAPRRPLCEVCRSALTDTKFKDGRVWSADDLASAGRKKYGKVLCMTHYREAKHQAPREELPF